MLTALTSLSLASGGTREALHNWQHLLPLTRLQDLSVICCGITALPEQVSMLTGVTRLNLSRNRRLSSGWQHLLRLPRLRWLDLRSVDFVLKSFEPPELTSLQCLLHVPHLHIEQPFGLTSILAAY